MHAVEARGLQSVVGRIQEFQQTLDPGNWELAPLLERLSNDGGSLMDV
jgi:hypothetical protein